MDSAGGDSPLMGVCSFCFLPQERISYIGPEEFVQAFVQKDPLDNDKVASDFRCGRERPNQKNHCSWSLFSMWLRVTAAA